MLKLTVPLAMEQVFRILIASVDTLMLSSFSEKAVAGVGVVAQYSFFLNILFSVIVTGTTIVLAQYLGADKSDDELNSIAQSSTVMVTAISIVMTLVVLFFTKPLLNCYTLEDEVRQAANDYFIIYGGICAFFCAFSLLQSGILRSYGYTKEALYVTIIANLVNVFGNAISIYGDRIGLPVFGVKGVAWASGISMIVSCVLLQIIIMSKKDIKFNLKNIFNVDSKYYRLILNVGVPTAGESLSYNTAQIVSMAMITTLGTYAMNAQIYTQTIIRFAYAIAIAMGNATQIKVGYLVGAHQSDVAYKKVYRYWIASVGFSLSLVAVCNLIKTPVIKIFTQNPQTAAFVISLLLVSFYIEFGRTMNLIFIGALKGSGDVMFPVLYGIVSMWAIIVGFGAFLGLGLKLGIVGFWLATGTEETTRGIVMFFRWKSKRWQKHAIV